MVDTTSYLTSGTDVWTPSFRPDRVLAPLFRDGRAAHPSDQYVKDKNGNDSLFETICNDAELVFAQTTPPPPHRILDTYGMKRRPFTIRRRIHDQIRRRPRNCIFIRIIRSVL